MAAKSSRFIRLLAHRPGCVCGVSFGIVVILLAVFALGIIQGTIPFEINYSSSELDIDGDEIADRARAFDAAKAQTSVAAPGHLHISVSRRRRRALSAVEYEYRRFGRLYFVVEKTGGSNVSLFDGDALLRLARLQDELSAFPRLQALCRRSGSHYGAPNSTRPAGECVGFLGPLRLLRASTGFASRGSYPGGCCDDCGTATPGCLTSLLCRTNATQISYQLAQSPSVPMAARTDTPQAFLDGARSMREAFVAEATCSSSALRDKVGEMLELELRSGAVLELRRFIEQVEVGGWQPRDISWSDYRSTHSAAKALYTSFVANDVLGVVAAFNSRNPDLRVSTWSFGTSTHFDLTVQGGLLNAVFWAAGGLVAGSAYMMLHIRSAFITLAGLLGLFLSFPLAWFFYAGPFSLGEMGIFNFMALFIIIAIGVDDIFVFFDAWRQAGALGHASLEARMGTAYRRACHAMFITSVTDACAFFANGLAPVPAIRRFGVFMGTLVVINFLLVITYFPAVIALHHRWMMCCSCTGRARLGARVMNSAGTEGKQPEVPPPSTSESHTRTGGEPTASRTTWTRFIETFLATRMMPALVKARVVVMLGALALISGSAASLTMFEFTQNDFQAESFQEGTNLMNFLSQDERFRAPPVDRVTVAWGVAGLDVVAETGGADDAFSGDAPVWDSQFLSSVTSSAEAQRAALHVCVDGAQLDLLDAGGHTCFIKHFRDWLVELDGPAGFPAAPSAFIPLLDSFTTFAKNTRSAGSSACAGVVTKLLSSNHSTFDSATLTEQCEAFWRSAQAHQRGSSSSSLPDWSAHVLWSCPLDEIERRCVPEGTRGYLPREYVPTLRAFYFEFNVRFSRYASAAAARRYFDAFEALTREANRGAPGFVARQSSAKWKLMRVEESLISSGLRGVAIALVVAFAALLVILANIHIAVMAMLHVGAICVCTVASLVWMGWTLGFIEALCIIVVIGFSVDFVAHVAIAYAASPAEMRYERTAQAVGELGISIISGAASTGLVALFMTQCIFVPFMKVGVFMLVSIAFSILFSLVVFPTALAVLGPTGSTGSLVTLLWRTRAIKGGAPAPADSATPSQNL